MVEGHIFRQGIFLKEPETFCVGGGLGRSMGAGNKDGGDSVLSRVAVRIGVGMDEGLHATQHIAANRAIRPTRIGTNFRNDDFAMIKLPSHDYL